MGKFEFSKNLEIGPLFNVATRDIAANDTTNEGFCDMLKYEKSVPSVRVPLAESKYLAVMGQATIFWS